MIGLGRPGWFPQSRHNGMTGRIIHPPKGIGQCRTYSGSESPWGSLRPASLTSACAITREEPDMTIDLWLAAITAAGLLIYLVAVLVRPERF
jgi:K+-transporting ATPase KdpF subunit